MKPFARWRTLTRPTLGQVPLATLASLTMLVAPLAAVAGCSGASGTGDDGAATLAASHPAPAVYDGQALFQAVYFNQGPAASKLASVWADRPALSAERTPEELAQLLDNTADGMTSAQFSAAAIADLRGQASALRSGTIRPRLDAPDRVAMVAGAIASQIERTDPTFFDGFAEEIQSGDPLRVSAVLRAGSRALVEAHAVLLRPALTARPLPVSGTTPTPVKLPIPIVSPTPVLQPNPVGGLGNGACVDVVLTNTDVVINTDVVYASVGTIYYIVAFPGGTVVDEPIGGGELGVESEVVVAQVTAAFAAH